MQLWVAQLEANRHGEPDSEHHEELPRVELPGVDATVLVGSFAGASSAARVLLLGGEPFKERIVMWWNFVGRSREELTDAARQWAAADERFGRVATSLPRVPLPPPQ